MKYQDRHDLICMFCSREGTILYADPRFPPPFKVGRAIGELIGRKLDIRNGFSVFLTENGIIEFFRIKERQFDGLVGIMCSKQLHDIVVRKLEDANKELDDIIESSHDGIVVADKDGVYIRVNANYEFITGIKKEKILGSTARSIVDEGLVSDAATLHVLKDGHSYTFAQVFPGGRQSVVTGSPLFDKSGRIYRVVTNVRDMSEINRLKEKLVESQKKLAQYSRLVETLTEEQMANEKLIFRSRKMETVRNCAIKFAKVDTPLLIMGESGSGKEVIANIVYSNSPRKDLPFLKINCGAIPENLLESELFGYEGGAFSGAKKEGQAGLLEIANGGTVMLDEIGELSLALQVKLLRFVEQKEFFRVGGNKVIKIDVRLIAATNRNLQKMVDQKQFRLDLFYRLNVLSINIPPLRERIEDVVPLVNYMLKKYLNKYDVHKRLSSDIYRAFTRYNWMGNVRELENLIERLVVISDREEITAEYLPDEIRTVLLGADVERDEPQRTYREVMNHAEMEFIRKSIEKYKSSRRTARMIGLDHSTVVKKAAKYGINFSTLM